MKRIILSAMALAFAVAVQAGDGTTCQAKDKDAAGGCCHKMKTSEQAEGTCPFAAQAGDCCHKMKTSEQAEGTSPFAKSTCCKQASAKNTSVKQPVLLSPKAADLVW